jgi:small subunit ribosomal protein S6
MTAKEKKYETVYILRPDLTDEATKKVNDKIAEVIARFGGLNLAAKDLTKKSLAYRIEKHTKGHYFQLNYSGPGQVIEELERHMKLSEDVIRFLTVRDEAVAIVEAVQTPPVASTGASEVTL